MPPPGMGTLRRPGSGPVQGLRSAGVQTMGAAGGGMGGRQPLAGAAAHGQQVNQNIQQTHSRSPFLNQQGGYTHTTGPAPMAVGHTGFGQNIYGWVNGQPVLTPTQNYVQFAPGEGPGGGGGGSRGPSQPAGPPMGGLVDSIQMPGRIGEMGRVDDSEAVREAYARAKDTAGQQGRAALDSLMDLQGARGIVGSGIGINEAGGVIAEGARQLGDFNREQAIQRAENERRRMEMNYQGNINQRGQDMGWQRMEMERRRYNAGNSPYGHVQGGPGVNPVPMPYPRY